jgi:hypothetical protein
MVAAAAMEKVQLDLGELKAQGASVAESLRSMTDALTKLNAWMPHVDGTIGSLQKSMEEVNTRVTALEVLRSGPDNCTPREGVSRVETGVGGGSYQPVQMRAAAVGRGKRHFHHTPVQFELGEPSCREDELDGSTILESRSARNTYNSSYQRMPKTGLVSLSSMVIIQSGGVG